MVKIKIFIGKNKNKKEDKHPDLKVAVMKTNEYDGKTVFIEAGALWKSKTGSGYVGEIETDPQPYKKPEPVVDTKTSAGYNGEVIDLEDLEF